jgi:hypothetical protein
MNQRCMTCNNDCLHYRPKQKDAINPSHYQGEIECIDAIKASMPAEQYKGYLKGNIIKYIWRYEKKGGSEDLEKAEWYIERLIKEVE